MKAIMMLPPQPIDERIDGLPSGVSQIVTKALQKNREERFESAKALADAIDKVLHANANLPEVNLNSVVTLPVELSSDDVRTIAMQSLAPEDGGNGTLAAQELAGARSSQVIPTPENLAHAIANPAPRARKSALPLVAGVMGAALAVGVGVAILVVRMDGHNSVDAKTVGAQASTPPPLATASQAPSRVVVAPIEAPALASSVPATSATESAATSGAKPTGMIAPAANFPPNGMHPTAPGTKPAPATKPPTPPAGNTGGNSRDNPGF
jgi:serine/threonine-protein kinase